MIENLRIIPSEYAEKLFTEDFYEADCWGGRGRGGSHNITLHAITEMITQPYFRGYLVRAIQQSLRDSLWQDFKDRIQEISDLNSYELKDDFHIVDNEMKAIYKPNGNTIKSKGFKASSKSNTANMKSIAGATHVYIEECEEVGRQEYNKLADSLRTIKAPVKIIRSWNAPPKSHWLVEDYYNLEKAPKDGYYTLKPKGLLNHISIFGTYEDNIKNLDINTLARYQRYEQTDPRYFFNQIKGYVSDGGDSKVYYSWKPISAERFEAIDGVESYGVDFGDTSPTSLIHVKFKDGCLYRRQLLYRSLRSLALEFQEEMAEVRKNIKSYPEEDQNNIWNKHKGLISFIFDRLKVSKKIKMFCDPAQKGLIIELRQAGYNAIKANKDKKANINFINRAVNYYTDDSLDLEREYNKYYLETDINKDPIDGKPKKGEDHALDGAEYGAIGLKDYYKIIL